MAKIEETIFVVKLSRLVRDNGTANDAAGFDELPATIEEVVQQLVSSEVVVEVVEVEKA